MGKPTVLTYIAATYCLKIDVQWKGKSEPETSRNHCFCWQNMFGCPAALKPPMMGTTRVEPRHVEGHTA